MGRDQKYSMIVDLTDLGWKNVDMEIDKKMAFILKNYFIERLHRVYCFPTGWFIQSLWSIVKYFYDERTRNKFKLLYNSKEAFVDLEKKYIP